MSNIQRVLALCVLVTGLHVFTSIARGGDELVLHVAPNGLDAWSGKAADPLLDKSDGPLATLKGARNRIRALRRKRAARGMTIRVKIADGVYRLRQTLEFKSEDSGTAEHPVIYEAAPNASPVISGGRVITGWKRWKKGWVAVVGKTRGDSWPFRQLFVNGKRYVRARQPNVKDYWIFSEDRGTVSNGTGVITYNKGEVRKLPGWKTAEIFLYRVWDVSRYRVTDIDTRKRKISFRLPKKLTKLAHNDRRFFLENAIAFLDSPGEWFLDERTGSTYLIPETGDNPANSEVIVPRLRYIMRLAGEEGKPVGYLKFRGLTFRHSKWPFDEDGYDGHQADVVVGAAIEGDYVISSVFENCLVESVGTYGIWLRRGCRDNRIELCEFRDLGAGGVMIGEKVNPVKEAYETKRNSVLQCRVHNNGRVYPSCIGMWVGYAGYTHLAYNHIHNTTYSGMSIGWGWTDKENAGGHNLIEHNHIHDVVLEMGDAGCIYTLGRQTGTIIRNNICHDTQGVYTYGPGIYMDQGSAEITVENNLVARTIGAALVFHEGGRHIVRNNIIAFPATGVVHHSRSKGNRVEGNIIVFDESYLFKKEWTAEAGTFARNLYFHPEGEIAVSAKLDYKQWRDGGQDKDSIFADPGFIDVKAGNFNLRAGSPADKIGFKPFKMPVIGPARPDRRDDPRMVKLFKLDRHMARSNFISPQAVLYKNGEPTGLRGDALPAGFNAEREKGLVAWLPFENIIKKKKYKALDAYVMSGAKMARGRIGRGLRLDGKGAHIQIPADKLLELTDTITLSAWVKLAPRQTPGFGVFGIIDRPQTYRLTVTNNKAPYRIALGLFFDGRKYGGTQTKVIVKANRWTFIAATYDSKTGVSAIYINGKQEKVSKGRPGRKLVQKGGSLSVGRRDSRTFLKGLVDEVKVYSRVLSEAEIMSAYRK